MPLDSQIQVDAPGAGTPQDVAAQLINNDLYQGLLICDASGNIMGSTANPLHVEEVRPPGSTHKILIVEGEVGIQADTPVATVITNLDGTELTGQTQIPVTSGKRFKVCVVQYTVYAVSGTTPPWIRVRLRYNPSGNFTTSSPRYLSMVSAPSAAANNSSGSWAMANPAGLVDLPVASAGAMMGFTKSGPATTPANSHFNLTLVGYEYTP
jgi:hypothetical protein